MSICPRCGASFECGMADASMSTQPCWCTLLPALPRSAYITGQEETAAGCCFCPHCLRILLDAAQAKKPDGA